MADKIIETHNVNTMEHEMKTQGCHLKEIKKMTVFHKDNFDKKTICVHVRTIEDDRHRVRSFNAEEHFINGWPTGKRTEETVIRNPTTSLVHFEKTEMTSGEIVEFEEDWKKLWHPKMTQGELENGQASLFCWSLP